MTQQQVKTRTALFEITTPGVLKITVAEDVLVDELDVLDNLLVIRNLTAGKEMARLIDTRNPGWSMTDAAKQTAKKMISAEKVIATAILVRSGITSSFLNLFKRFYSGVPVKHFKDEEPALVWLREFITKK